MTAWLTRISVCGFAVFCRTQLVSLDWHHMRPCNIQLHSGRPSLSLGSVQKTVECEALPRGFEGAVPYGRKVWETKFAAFLGRGTMNLRTRNAKLAKSCSTKHLLILLRDWLIWRAAILAKFISRWWISCKTSRLPQAIGPICLGSNLCTHFPDPQRLDINAAKRYLLHSFENRGGGQSLHRLVVCMTPDPSLSLSTWARLGLASRSTACLIDVAWDGNCA